MACRFGVIFRRRMLRVWLAVIFAFLLLALIKILGTGEKSEYNIHTGSRYFSYCADPYKWKPLLKSGKPYKLQMRTEMADIRKEGWDSDYLPKACRQRQYGDLRGWPKASVVISFCDNEKYFDVLHTIHSIFQRSPDVLLQEVILVDDNSRKEDFGETFRLYLDAVFGDKVHLIRNNQSLGLIKARLLGCRHATGDVIVVMDAHMEVQDTWLEALLWEIRKNSRTLATPALDWMIYDEKSGWTYRAGFNSFLCVFGWNLGFGFGFSRPEIESAWRKDNTMSIPAPCTVGTVWAMQRRFFEEIGQLDEGMEKWGAENLDLAIRTWLFGGRAVQVPCSHAAHLERPHQRDYRLNWDRFTNKNYKRIIDVWFDDYRKHVLLEKPELKSVDSGNLTERLALKTRALHNFTWFLDNVFPELGVYDRNTIGYGWLRNVGLNKCIHRIGSDPLRLWTCTGEHVKEGLFLTVDGYLRTDLQTWHVKDKCLGCPITPEGATGTYHEPWLSQWIHWKDGPMLLYEADGKGTERSLCMEAFTNGTLSTQRCDIYNINQRWQWKVYTSDYNDIFKKKPSSNIHKELLRVKQLWHILETNQNLHTKSTTTAR